MNKRQSYGIVSLKDAFDKALKLNLHPALLSPASLKNAVLDWGGKTVDCTIVKK